MCIIKLHIFKMSKHFISISTIFFVFFTLKCYSAEDTIFLERIKSLEDKVYLLEKDKKNNDRTDFNFEKLRFSGKLYFETMLKDKQNTYSKFNYSKVQIKLTQNFSDKTSFVFSLKSNDSSPKISDAYLNVNYDENNTFSLGNMGVDYNMDSKKNENYLSTLPIYFDDTYTNFIPSYGTGFFYERKIKSGALHFGYLGNSLVDNKEDTSKTTLSLRAFVFPINNGKTVLHFGLNKNNVFNRLKKGFENSEFKDIDGSMYYTKFNVKKVDSYGFEMAFKKNFFTLEYEANLLRFVPYVKNNYSWFKAFSQYVEASLILTGESKEYYDFGGSFGRISVKNPITSGGYGAFELVGRFKYIDGYDKGAKFSVDLAKNKIMTIGLNWLPINKSKILFSYSKVNREYRNNESKDFEEIKIVYKFFF